MKKRLLIAITLLLLVSMLGSMLASCGGTEKESNSPESSEAVESDSKTAETNGETSADEESSAAGSEAGTTTDKAPEAETESETESETEIETEKVSLIDGPYADLIENANGLKNTVQA